MISAAAYNNSNNNNNYININNCAAARYVHHSMIISLSYLTRLCDRLADLIEIEGGVEYMILTHKDDIGDLLVLEAVLIS